MIQVSKKARRYHDRAGDPLDGLVNLFDVGVVLAVAFLLAALSNSTLTDRLTNQRASTPTTPARPGETVRSVPASLVPTSGYGTQVGRVYRLPDGRLVFVVPSSVAAAPTPTPSPSPSAS